MEFRLPTIKRIDRILILRYTVCMNKLVKGFQITGLILSILVGMWHFVAPGLHKWFSYIPDVPSSLVVSIVWTNFFFSLLLTGLSVLLLIFHKRISKDNPPLLWFYGFFVAVWLCRVVITIFMPMNGYDVIFWGSMSVFIIIFGSLAIPLVSLMKGKEATL